MIDDLKIIRKKYGEKMYHFCREAFPILLEEPGKLSKLLMDNFHESHSLYDDIEADGKLVDFKNYIYSLVDVENNNEIVEIKTPEELMAEAGYDLFECYSEEDIQKYKKYYAPGEELCTFRGGRLNSCRVFFAVKKNVDDIRREDFKNPTRQDEYGTSVISIQFEKDGTNTLSIKNRYNHMVNNPDATFSNNLDNIIPGLTDSFEKYKGIIQKYKNNSFEISNYVRANDGKYYKYNYEFYNIYYCPDNIIIDNFEVKKYDKSRYLIIDYFIIDMSKDNKSISLYDRIIRDCFCDLIKEITKIEIDNIDDGKKIKILGSNDEYLEISVDKNGKIISLKMDNVCEIEDAFLYENVSLRELYLPKLTTVGHNFLHRNKFLQELYAPNLTTVGNYFLYNNKSLKKLSLPKLTAAGMEFLVSNQFLQELYAPNLEKVGGYFLAMNGALKELSLPYLTTVGSDFLYCNNSLQELILRNLREIGANFLYCNNSLQELSLPNLQKVGDKFLFSNIELRNRILLEMRMRNENSERRRR